MKKFLVLKNDTYRKFDNNNDAVSPAIGVIMIIGVIWIMATSIGATISGLKVPAKAPMAYIAAAEANGGLPSNYSWQGIGFDDNTILIKHKGGESLRINDTKIIIRGSGQSYRPCFGCGYVPPASPYIGETSVIYTDITASLKDVSYKNNNPSLNDGIFQSGESLLLSGVDRGGQNDDNSSVVVSVNSDGNTSNKYAFKNDAVITITFVDIPSNLVIGSTKVYVKKAS